MTTKGKTQRFTTVAVVLMVALVVGPVAGNYSIASGGGKAATQEMTGKEGEAKDSIVQAGKEVVEEMRPGEDVKETAESWTGWAKEKIQEGLGLKYGEAADASKAGAHKVEEGVSDGGEKAQTTKENVQETSKKATNTAYDKAASAKEKASEMANEAANKAGEMKDAAVEMANEAANKAGEMKDAAVETAGENLEWAKEKVKGGYEGGKKEGSETWRKGQEKVNQQQRKGSHLDEEL